MERERRKMLTSRSRQFVSGALRLVRFFEHTRRIQHPGELDEGLRLLEEFLAECAAHGYAWGRATSRVHMDNGRKRVLHGVRLKADDWKVLIHDHHDDYITWADYERNQRLIADNAVVNKGAATRGATRAGKALLTGLMRCGHCGRKLQVGYRNTQAPRYQCRGTDSRDGKRCITFTTERVDEVVSAAVLRALQPLGVEAALHAIDNQGREADDGMRQAELMLEERKPASGRIRRVAAMKRSIQTTDLLPATLSKPGTSACTLWRNVKRIWQICEHEDCGTNSPQRNEPLSSASAPVWNRLGPMSEQLR